MRPLKLTLNGEEIEVTDLDPRTTLLQFLRRHRLQTGTKEGCAEGDCGACTVAVLHEGPQGPTYRAVNACLMLLPQLDGRVVITVEGLSDAATEAKRRWAKARPKGGTVRLHPAQEAMVEALGSQCGYCTPGFVMSLFEATYRSDLDAPWKRDDQICGNLCRCTGYRPIRKAMDQVAGNRPQDRFAEVLRQPVPTVPPLEYGHGARRFVAPGTLEALYQLRARHPEARIVAGATDLGLEVTRRRAELPFIISLQAIP